MRKDNSLEKDLMVGITSDSIRRGCQRKRWLDCMLRPCEKIVTDGNILFIESPEIEKDLTAHREMGRNDSALEVCLFTSLFTFYRFTQQWIGI